MIDTIILAGFGGQGVLFTGKILAVSAMLNDLEVCWIPSYGPEMRGGTANCSVIVSDETIYSTVVTQADAAIALNQPSYEKFLNSIKPGGVMVMNSSLIQSEMTRDDITIIRLPAAEIAHQLGRDSIANVVCLGALLPYLKLADYDDIANALREEVAKKRPEMLEINLSAIQKGMDFAKAL